LNRSQEPGLEPDCPVNHRCLGKISLLPEGHHYLPK